MKKGQGFNPAEIIFAVTDKCNLKCPHCFVQRKNNSLSSQDAIKFLDSCKTSSIDTIGFSGGEPFLNIFFLEEIIRYAVKNGFMFDRLMTNGSWWQNEQELKLKLQRVYDAGFDGKIGFSWDSFHGQTAEQAAVFIKNAVEIWNDGSVIEIQSVVNSKDYTEQKKFLEKIQELCRIMNFSFYTNLNKRTGCGGAVIRNEKILIKTVFSPQSHCPENNNSWQDRKWFKEDFCSDPGQILYVHPDGRIAPCCGFSNEEPAIIIGNINQNLSTVLEQAAKNRIVKTCYVSGLSSRLKELKKAGVKFPGKTTDNCVFCSYLCRNTF